MTEANTEAVTSDAQTEAEETDTAVTEEVKAPEFETPEHNWSEVAEDENAPAAPKLLAPVMLLADKANDLRTKYLSMTDIDSAVESYLDTAEDEELKTLRKQIEQAEKLIAKNKAAMEEKARKAVTADIDPDFDEQKSRAAYNDLIVAIKTQYNDGLRSIFKTLGHLKADVSESGRETNWRAASGYGQLLLNAYKLPKLEKAGETSSSTSGKTDPAVTAWNKAAKDWGRKNGFAVKDKGALSLELKEAYQKHLDSQSA
jgi:hypothetical protein